MAHSIEFEGRTYPMHLAELLPDGTLSLRPFTGETGQTVFINGAIRIIVDKTAFGEAYIRYINLP